ncbi:MAG TPA: glycosyltransferase, partial [Geminicoccaceae bacterium]|nr:glycosyltransferase [Geminicoccaceae bacterium]
MRIAYLTTCSPIPAASGHSLRVFANWQAMRRIATVDLYAFDTRLPLTLRRDCRDLAITTLPARRESRRALLARHLKAFFRGEGMMYAKAISPRRTARLAAELRARRTDLLVLGDTWLAGLLPALRHAAHRVVVDTHNVESRLYRRILAEQSWRERVKTLLYWRNVIALERHLREADAVWCVSGTDARIYREDLGLARVAVLPNAIDTDAYRPADLVDVATSRSVVGEVPAIVFTGSYGYWPNATAALHLIDLARRLAAAGVAHRVCLVGRDPTAAMRAAAADVPWVIITGAVPDVRPWIAGAALVVAPLTSGSGTKYKVLEALAMAKAVVTTPIGAEGLDLVDGTHAAIAPDLDALYGRVRRLIADPVTCARLGRAGRAWVDATHSPTAL